MPNPMLDDHIASAREKFEMLEELVQGLCAGHLNGLIVSGATGIGKTHTVMSTIERHRGNKKVLAISGHVTPMSLFKTLQDNAEKTILVFDDCDECFQNQTALNILKAAMNMSSVRLVSWISSALSQQRASANDTFSFKGQVVVITNVLVARSTHYKSFVDRCHSIEMRLSSEERIAKVWDISRNSSRVKDHELGAEVAEWMLDNRGKIGQDISCRTFYKLYDLALFSKRWKVLASCMDLSSR